MNIVDNHCLNKRLHQNSFRNWESIGLTLTQSEIIKKFYLENIDRWQDLKKPLHIRKDPNNQLPRSLIYVPEGSKKGLHILLKRKGVKEIDRRISHLTLAFHFEAEDLKVCRSITSSEEMPWSLIKSEMKINERLQEKSDFFVAGPSASYEKNSKKKCAFILDYLKEGDLFDYIKNKKIETINQAVHLGKKIVKVVQKLHKNGIIHQDLKPDNFMIEKEELKLIDFNLSGAPHKTIDPRGTPNYIAPEIYEAVNEKRSFISSFSVDIWAIGCILSLLRPKSKPYWWINGEWPFTTEKSETFNQKKKEFLPQFNNPFHLDYVINKCFEMDPKKRPNIKQVAEMMEQLK